MHNYARYMDRQRLSETGLARLMRLETERPRKDEEREGHISRWVKYCGMAACLVLAVGALALAVLQGGGGVGINPVATAGPGPVATEELFFNEMGDSPIPFTDQAIAGDMTLTPMEMTDVAALFGCFLEDYGDVLEELGWSELKTEYYRVGGNTHPETGKDAFRFVLAGYQDITSPSNPSEFQDGVVYRSSVNLEIFEAHSYSEETDWAKLESCQFNGHGVVAACSGKNDRAAAAFDVTFAGKTYGVLYSVRTYGEQNAKELVTKLVERVTEYGVFPERAVEAELPGSDSFLYFQWYAFEKEDAAKYGINLGSDGAGETMKRIKNLPIGLNCVPHQAESNHHDSHTP